jgi:ATP-binding cassette subfamily B protein
VLVIAHRLRLAQRADRIAVLDHGRVVEIGPPAKLLAARGAYRRLVDDHGGDLNDDRGIEAQGDQSGDLREGRRAAADEAAP